MARRTCLLHDRSATERGRCASGGDAGRAVLTVAGYRIGTARLRLCAVALAIAAWPQLPLLAEALSVHAADGAIYVRAPQLGLIEGATLKRLRDGRTVRVVFELTLMSSEGGPPVAQAHERFYLSYDLWEQRFAATKEGTPPR